MRSPWSVFLLSLLVGLSVVYAQERNRTDAQRDDLAGPVKSAASRVTYSGVKWQQPDGPTLVLPIWCRDCEYDSDGTKTKSGQVVDGSFRGEIVRLIRDANGNVTDRLAIDASTGQTARHEVIGPFGKTEQTIYLGGEVRWRHIFSYDPYGHMTEWLSLDSAGRQESRSVTNTDKEGNVLERSVWGKDDELDWLQTYDPETPVEHFTTYDQSGKVKLTWTVAYGKVASFWELGDSSSQFGDHFSEDVGDGNVDNYACHNNGECEPSRIHYEYLDAKKRNPQSAEWQDSEGNLRFAAYYNYAIDSFRNWTYREVWVWTPELRNRTLYETDFRNITYWTK
jgi:hypothetical protein